MKAGPSSNDRYHIMAEINMIPLIDVSLVLLIIFMVMTPFLVQSQIQVNLPKVSTVVPTPDPPMQVQVTKDGSFYIQGKHVPKPSLVKSIGSLFADPAAGQILIQADKDASFEHVVEAMDAAKQAGVKKMGVAVIQKSE